MKLQDKVAIITGPGERGIGRATAEEFAKEGAIVVVNDINKTEAQETVDAITSRGGTAMLAIADGADSRQVYDAVASVLSKYQRIDILVNNTSGNNPYGKYFHQSSLEEITRTIQDTLFSTINWSRAVIEHMIARRYGKILVISSFVAATGGLGGLAYATAKSAYSGFAASLAKEVGQFGINVNGIMPGFAEPLPGSDRLEKMPERRKELLSWTHFGRIGKSEEFAKVNAFLASDDASWISGTIIPVEGGITHARPM